jgi:DNA polymerase III epsilon subunit-like protein
VFPCIVIDTETTGCPWAAGPGWCPEVIEVGAVSLDADGAVADTFEVLVRRPRAHLLHPRSAPAAAVHGITPARVEAEGVAPLAAAATFRSWLIQQRVEASGVVLPVTGWRFAFDLHFLVPRPWQLFLTGLRPAEDLQAMACRVLGLRDRPHLDPLLAALRAAGELPHRVGPRHRALTDAQLEAELLVALRALEARPPADRPRLPLPGGAP